MPNIAEDIRLYLIDQGISDPIKIGGHQDGPGEVDVQITILEPAGGTPPDLSMGPTVVQRNKSLQIVVRGEVDGYDAASTLMESVYQAVVATGPFTANSNAYRSVKAQGEYFNLPLARTERPLFSLNILVQPEWTS